MHGVLRTYRVEAKNVGEIVRRASEEGSAAPAIMQSIPGFVTWVILDGGPGTLLTYSVFEDRAGAEASTLKAAGWVRENIAALMPTPPTVVAGEVRLREVQGEPKHGVIRRYQIEPRNVDQIVERAREGFLPILRRVPGFASYSILDAGGGTLLTASAFASRESAAESVAAAAAWVKEHLAALVPAPPEVTNVEVLFRVAAPLRRAADSH